MHSLAEGAKHWQQQQQTMNWQRARASENVSQNHQQKQRQKPWQLRQLSNTSAVGLCQL